MEGSAGGLVRVGLSQVPPEVLASWVAASCAAQGVPVKVTDPTVLRRVGVLLGSAAVEGRGRKRSGTRPSTGAVPASSVSPLHADPVRVDSTDAGLPGADHEVVDQGGDDRVLPPEVEAVPRSA